MRFTNALALAAFAVSAAAAENCFPNNLCAQVEKEGFNCAIDAGNCNDHASDVQLQIYLTGDKFEEGSYDAIQKKELGDAIGEFLLDKVISQLREDAESKL